MKLRMQSHSGNAQDLPPYENVVQTGLMGDCVSVIALWNYSGTKYNNVRGWHGSGGISAIDFANLFNGVPNDAGTLLIVIFGSLGSDEYQQNEFRNAPNRDNLSRATIAFYRARITTDACVNRSGVVTEVGFGLSTPLKKMWVYAR